MSVRARGLELVRLEEEVFLVDHEGLALKLSQSSGGAVSGRLVHAAIVGRSRNFGCSRSDSGGGDVRGASMMMMTAEKWRG